MRISFYKQSFLTQTNNLLHAIFWMSFRFETVNRVIWLRIQNFLWVARITLPHQVIHQIRWHQLNSIQIQQYHALVTVIALMEHASVIFDTVEMNAMVLIFHITQVCDNFYYEWNMNVIWIGITICKLVFCSQVCHLYFTLYQHFRSFSYYYAV